MVHIKCRRQNYLKENVQRLIFTDNLVPWSVIFMDYNPPEYNSNILRNKTWADPDINDPNFKPNWNQLDNNVNRTSHSGKYEIFNNRPLNPKGRTGLKGRGVLGRWGPNHAADPIVTRWKRENGNKQIHELSKLPILQFCAIQRRDCNEWAIPGGMIDPGEKVNNTLQREFLEEALNLLESTPDTATKNKQLTSEFFKSGNDIYSGYVDDPRNTDNAWMETVAVNFHDEDNTAVGKFKLKAGDDAKSVRWIDIDKALSLYASHSELIKTVAHLWGAHW